MRCLAPVLLAIAALMPAQELRVTVYDGYAPAEITDGFSKWAKDTLRRDVTVKVTVVGNNNEAHNAIRTGSADVCVATSNMLGSERYKLITGKLVQPIDSAPLSNYADLMPSLKKPGFLVADGKQYGVPMNWGFAFADLAKAGEPWAVAEPTEGTLGYVDSFVLSTSLSAELKPLAMAYIDYTISPAAQAVLARGCGGMSVNIKTKALLTDDEAKAA